MTSFLSVIRAAVRPGAADDVLDQASDLGGVEPGAQALNPEPPHVEAPTSGGNMSGIQTAAGAASAAAPLIAAAAAASGGADGFKTAMDRITAVLGAEGIKGDGKRMQAALDLATGSPDMAAEAVVAFVTANVPAGSPSASAEAAPAVVPAASQPKPAAGAYEAQVQAAASLAMPGGVSAQAAKPAINRDAIYAARRIAPKGV